MLSDASMASTALASCGLNKTKSVAFADRKERGGLICEGDVVGNDFGVCAPRFGGGGKPP